MVLSQQFIYYRQNHKFLLWRSTLNLISGVLASATWPSARHDISNMYVVAPMTSGRRSWPKERPLFKLFNIPMKKYNEHSLLLNVSWICHLKKDPLLVRVTLKKMKAFFIRVSRCLLAIHCFFGALQLAGKSTETEKCSYNSVVDKRNIVI